MDNLINIDLLRSLCKSGNVLYSAHALERIHSRGIFRKDIINAILNGEIIEQYPNDRIYPSCLVFGYSINSEIIHIVCGTNGETLVIITAYFPSKDLFEEDMKTRRII